MDMQINNPFFFQVWEAWEEDGRDNKVCYKTHVEGQSSVSEKQGATSEETQLKKVRGIPCQEIGYFI